MGSLMGMPTLSKMRTVRRYQPADAQRSQYGKKGKREGKRLTHDRREETEAACHLHQGSDIGIPLSKAGIDTDKEPEGDLEEGEEEEEDDVRAD